MSIAGNCDHVNNGRFRFVEQKIWGRCLHHLALKAATYTAKKTKPVEKDLGIRTHMIWPLKK